jgi:hypothetical protein
MEHSNDNSFWRSNVKMVPGRPSPTKDIGRSTTAKNSSTSFEKYQKSVSDAWTLSEDELTKEYCILTDETKPPRRPNQNIAKAHKNSIAVVHRQSSSTSPPAVTNIPTDSATTSTANNNIEPIVEEEIQKVDVKQKVERRTLSEKSYEYGYVDDLELSASFFTCSHSPDAFVNVSTRIQEDRSF